MYDLMKESIIDILFKNLGKFYSGKKMAEILGISSVAVWKRVKNLINEGYEIEAVPKLGYRLSDHPTRLWPSGYDIKKTKWLPNTILFQKKVSSTMDTARNCYKNGSRVIALAREQTAGRGRHGNKWFSPTDSGIYMSVAVKPNLLLIRSLPLINIAACAAVHKLLKERYRIDTKIKWPNDIYYNSKKICGILIESETEGNSITYIAIGIGLDLKENENYGSLSENGSYINPIELVSLLTGELDKQLDNITNNHSSLLSYWKSNNNTIGKKILIDDSGTKISGYAKDIDENGYLIVMDTYKEKKVISGEIVFLEGVNEKRER